MADVCKNSVARFTYRCVLVTLVWIAAMCAAVAEEDMVDTEDEPAQAGTMIDTGVPIITSGEVTSSGGLATGGPSVEFITGGNSTDGAAKVGRLPVID